MLPTVDGIARMYCLQINIPTFKTHIESISVNKYRREKEADLGCLHFCDRSFILDFTTVIGKKRRDGIGHKSSLPLTCGQWEKFCLGGQISHRKKLIQK